MLEWKGNNTQTMQDDVITLFTEEWDRTNINWIHNKASKLMGISTFWSLNWKLSLNSYLKCYCILWINYKYVGMEQAFMRNCIDKWVMNWLKTYHTMILEYNAKASISDRNLKSLQNILTNKNIVNEVIKNVSRWR